MAFLLARHLHRGTPNYPTSRTPQSLRHMVCYYISLGLNTPLHRLCSSVLGSACERFIFLPQFLAQTMPCHVVKIVLIHVCTRDFNAHRARKEVGAQVE